MTNLSDERIDHRQSMDWTFGHRVERTLFHRTLGEIQPGIHCELFRAHSVHTEWNAKSDGTGWLGGSIPPPVTSILILRDLGRNTDNRLPTTHPVPSPQPLVAALGVVRKLIWRSTEQLQKLIHTVAHCMAGSVDHNVSALPRLVFP